MAITCTYSTLNPFTQVEFINAVEGAGIQAAPRLHASQDQCSAFIHLVVRTAFIALLLLLMFKGEADIVCRNMPAAMVHCMHVSCVTSP